MAKATEVERAYERCSILNAIVRHIRDDALTRPTETVWLNLGLVEEGDKKAEALARIEHLFDELQALIEHLFVLDMAAQFERASRARVKNYVGAARSALIGPMKKANFPTLSSKIIKEATDFEGMTAFIKLLEGHIDKDLLAQLKAVRNARNVFAHGIDVMVVPSISREEVRNSLTDALGAM